jgi:hypothetical protein
MVSLTLDLETLDPGALRDRLVEELRLLDPDAVVRVQLRGPDAEQVNHMLSASDLRELAPASMNIDLSHPARPQPSRSPSRPPSRS